MTANEFIKGVVWTCGDQVDTYKILPKEYWMGDIGSLDEEKLADHVMEGYDSNFAEEAREKNYKFIIAGKNFGGGGKSIEHPIYALKGIGIEVILAESVSRYFYRNLINNGILVIIQEGIKSFADTEDELTINLNTGILLNETKNKEINFTAPPEFLLKILNKGGYKNYIKDQLKASDN